MRWLCLFDGAVCYGFSNSQWQIICVSSWSSTWYYLNVHVCCIYSETELLFITHSPQRVLFNSDCSNIIPESSAILLFVGRGGGWAGSSPRPSNPVRDKIHTSCYPIWDRSLTCFHEPVKSTAHEGCLFLCLLSALFFTSHTFFYSQQNKLDFFTKKCWYHMTIIDHAALTKWYPERHLFHDTVNGLETLKNVPCSAAHTWLDQIRKCPLPPWKMFAIKLSCNDFDFIARPYPDFFSWLTCVTTDYFWGLYLNSEYLICKFTTLINR